MAADRAAWYAQLTIDVNLPVDAPRPAPPREHREAGGLAGATLAHDSEHLARTHVPCHAGDELGALGRLVGYLAEGEAHRAACQREGEGAILIASV